MTDLDTTDATRLRSRIPLLLACGGPFLAFLDVTITNLALPDIATDFHVGVGSLTWVVTLYTIFFAALLAPAGGFADVISRQRLFVIGVATFTAASFVAAVAPTYAVLIAARGVQGIGAAVLIPASLALVLADTAPERRTAAIGLWSASGALAAAFGPALGGVVVDSAGWRWLFLLNLPIGLGLLYAATKLHTPRPEGGRVPDLIGTTLVTGSVGLLILAITKGQDWGWDGTATIMTFVAAALTGIIALARSARHPQPAIDTSLWANPTYAMANIVSLLYGIALYASLILGVLFLVNVWGYSELKAGFAMTPAAVITAVAAVVIGSLKRRPDPRLLVLGGGIVLAFSWSVVAVVLDAEPAFLALWLPVGVALGIGFGVMTVGISSAAALSVAPTRFASATGLNVAARQVGGAIGVAVLGVILAASTPADGLDPYRVLYWLVAGAAILAGVLGLRLLLAPAAPPAEPRPEI